jgi:broad specificity polyphosphatase/5'/3'-nucleotidase SurE
MRLLITNDDGIDSALLHALVGTLRAAGQRTVLSFNRVRTFRQVV